MLTSSIIFSLYKPPVLPSNLPNKDIGIISYAVEPTSKLGTCYKKSSANANCLAISATHIFVAQADKAVVQVYDRERGTKDADVPFGERITSCTFVGFDDGGVGILVLGLRDGRLVLWEICTGRQVSTSPAHLEDVDCLAVDTTRNFLLSGSKDHNVHIWNVPELMSFDSESRVPYKTFSDHHAAITAVVTGHSQLAGDFALSASEDRTILLWNYRDATRLATFLVSAIPRCLAVDPADRAFYVGFEDGVQVADLSGLSENPSSEATDLGDKNKWRNDHPLMCLAISADGTQLYTGHKNGEIIKRVVSGDEPAMLYDAHLPVTNIVALEPDGFLQRQPPTTKPSIVKPKSDLAVGNDSSIIPERYDLNVVFTSMLTPASMDAEAADLLSQFDALLEHPSFPDNLLKAPLIQSNGKSRESESDLPTDEELQSLKLEHKSAMEQVKTLTTQLDRLRRLELARIQSKNLRMLRRMKKSEAQALMRKKAMSQENGDMVIEEDLQALDDESSESDDHRVSAEESDDGI